MLTAERIEQIQRHVRQQAAGLSDGMLNLWTQLHADHFDLLPPGPGRDEFGVVAGTLLEEKLRRAASR